MDMEIIDTVRADSLEVGDTIEFFDDTDEEQDYYGLSEIKNIEDEGHFITIYSHDGDSMMFAPDTMVNIYGYSD